MGPITSTFILKRKKREREKLKKINIEGNRLGIMREEKFCTQMMKEKERERDAYMSRKKEANVSVKRK